MVKIYTKTGDNGETSRFDGQRVKKDDSIIQLNGIVDECNCIIGLAISTSSDSKINNILTDIQNKLFIAGTEISSCGKKIVLKIKSSDTKEIEEIIDIYEKELPPLTTFILPGGSITSSYLHLSRAKSREVERCLASISEEWIKDSNLNAFMNRLSDLFFVLARAVNKRSNIDDVPWNGKN